MFWQIKKRVNFGYSDSLRTVGNFCDVIACTNFALLQHAKVKSWPVMSYQQGWHSRVVHANTDSVARYPRLRHFKYGITNTVAIANADFVIWKSVDCEVLSELAIAKVFPSEKVFPVVIGVHLINKNGALL